MKSSLLVKSVDVFENIVMQKYSIFSSHILMESVKNNSHKTPKIY